MKILKQLFFSMLLSLVFINQAYCQTYPIKLSNVSSIYEFHEQLQKDLDLPYYYTKTWADFYGSLSDKLSEGQSVTFILSDLKNFEKRFPDDASKMMKAMNDLKAAYPKRLKIMIK